MKSWQEDLLGATDGAQCEHAVHEDIANEQRVTLALAQMSLTRIIVAHRPELMSKRNTP
ncbi:MAG: hypothetical protein WCH35_02435 [Comamonadaceae bacterium]